jgi:hypothetical protein
MKPFLLGLSLSVAFILGCVAAQHVPALAVPSAAAYAGPRWEYTCQPGPTPGSLGRDSGRMDLGKTHEALSQWLNELGADGWEITPVPAYDGTFVCFKRPQ